ncbi:MAG: carboxypeptidase-like regulatory domain-containing protein [Reichenbachiella sp.]
MKRILITIGMILAAAIIVNAQSTDAFLEISGRITDQKTKKVLPQSSVYIKGGDIGTVANNSGEFILKVPKEFVKGQLVASSVGYAIFEIDMSKISGDFIDIELVPVVVIMDEIVVRDVNSILNEALKKKNENYPLEYQVMTSFFRETVRKNRSYIDVSQGIISVNKSAYDTNSKDQMNIVKGSRVQNYKKEDTLAFKVMGGPNTMLMLDVVKNPGVVLHKDIFSYYKYELKDVKMVNNRRTYEISFKPKAIYDFVLYTGLLYIDVESFAVSGLSFGYGEQYLKTAGSDMIKKKPTFAKLTPTRVHYDVKYRSIGNKWYLDYVRNEIDMKCNWKKKLFNSNFSSVSEMVVTEKSSSTETNFSKNSITRSSDIFSEKVGGFYSIDFWENYSIIKPEDDLRKALAKIEKKKN